MCGLSAVNGRKPRTQPETGDGRQAKRTETEVDGDVVFEHTAESKNPRVRRDFLVDERIGLTQADDHTNDGKSTAQWITEARHIQSHNQTDDSLKNHVEALGATALPSFSPHSRSGGRRSSSQSSLWCSTPSPPTQGSSDYYPSRPISAGEAVAVSLISPRMSKRIQRLPRPAASELENLQVQAGWKHCLLSTNQPHASVGLVHCCCLQIRYVEASS